MSPKYLVTAAVLMCAAASVSAQSVKAGIEAWQRSDYSGAVAIWRPLAEKGDADAQFNLGQAYRLGRGVPINLAAAKTWFERAATQGHLDAETTLGLLLFQNNNQAEGLKWLKQAADKGEPRALLVYGTALVNGDGVTQNPVLGYSYVSRAADQGLAPAKDTLGQLDKLMPAEDRRKAMALARADVKAASPPAAVAEKPAQEPLKLAKVTATPKPKAAKAEVKPAAAAPKQSAPVKEATGSWRIQLGAFSQKGSAESLYSRLSGRSALAGRHAYYIPLGSVTRLQVGPFESKAAAAAACRALGQACFPVSGK